MLPRRAAGWSHVNARDLTGYKRQVGFKSQDVEQEAAAGPLSKNDNSMQRTDYTLPLSISGCESYHMCPTSI